MSSPVKRNQQKMLDTKRNDIYTTKIQAVTEDLIERVNFN